MSGMSAVAGLLALVLLLALGTGVVLLLIACPAPCQALWPRRALSKAGARTPRQHALLRELEDWHTPRAASDRPRVEAEERAWQLLQRTLSAEQARTLQAEGYFTVQAPSGRRYRLTHDGLIYGLRRPPDTPTESFCLVPTTELPCGDRVLALKLMIETNEQGFLRTARRQRLWWTSEAR
jgi:hypothetical protein